MLISLNVKNLALIDEAEVEFGEGLNILTGETGAGKSVVIGSINAALGGKSSKDQIRNGEDSAWVELVFSVDDEKKRSDLAALGIETDEDGLLIISKKIQPSRSVSKINGETVTASKLREITGLLIDIHGQHDHQSLLSLAKHLEILDKYGKARLGDKLGAVENCYRKYTDCRKNLEEFSADDEQRRRELDFCRFEIDEIENAGLKPGEEEELAEAYRKMANSRKIEDAVAESYRTVSEINFGSAIAAIERAMRYDEGLQNIKDELYDAESLLSDLEHELSDYIKDLTWDEEAFRETEDRLNLIRNLESKYGSSIEAVLKALEEKKARAEILENYDEEKRAAERALAEATKKLDKACGELSSERAAIAEILAERITEGLKELNFLEVTFRIDIRRKGTYSAIGFDEAEFMISTNPGEPVKPLKEVASGGEMSRIMLAIKTVLADTDDIPTLIFDEIDTGISGRTAQMVSEKMAVIARKHQVLCITHLPQIASMADVHFEISKGVHEGRTRTDIVKLTDEQMIDELARMLGGAAVTDTVKDNAREMKRLADAKKGH